LSFIETVSNDDWKEINNEIWYNYNSRYGWYD
jgi:hypothetical protein